MRRRDGFTLAEVAVSAALIAILAAATVPSFSEYLDMRDAVTTANTLSQLAAGVTSFGSSVRSAGTTGTYPNKISSLTNQIVQASTLNSCKATTTMTANAVTTYNASAPFVDFYVPVGGLKTPFGIVLDTMTRNPTTALVGTLAIDMQIDTIDALRLERVVDGDDGTVAANRTAGTLRITTSGTARINNVQYLVPVGARC